MERPFLTIPPRDDRESADGIHLELPFVPFQIPSRAGVAPRDEAYERARSKVLARLGFYRHVATYAVAVAALILIDAITGGGVGDVSRWIAAVWGAILLLHGFNVFIVPNVWSRETEERMIEEEMRKHPGA